jgi:hypothetical protein
MSNTFKAGDSITINQPMADNYTASSTRDTTTGKAYLLTAVFYRTGVENPHLQRVQFVDDIGDTVTIWESDVSLAEVVL